MGMGSAIVVNSRKEEFKQAREVLGHIEHRIGVLGRLRDAIHLNSRSIKYCSTISQPSLADGIAIAMARLSSRDLDALNGLPLLFWLLLWIENGRYDLSFSAFQRGCGVNAAPLPATFTGRDDAKDFQRLLLCGSCSLKWWNSTRSWPPAGWSRGPLEQILSESSGQNPITWLYSGK